MTAPAQTGPAPADARSALERALDEGRFALTCELGPPVSASAEPLLAKARQLRGVALAYNVTDCQTAVVRLSSLAASAALVRDGFEPVFQLTTRDRNRIALQSDVLGAAALGVRNVLCLAGDHQSVGAGGRLHGHPGARNVYDVDSVQLLAILRHMRDDGVLQSGDPIEQPPHLLIGAAWTPLADPVDYRVARLAKKAAAGAQFVQTQAVYDVEAFAAVMRDVRAGGLHERVAVLPGVVVPRSRRTLEYMDAHVPGVRVPASVMARMPPPAPRGAGEGERRAARAAGEQAGIALAADVCRRLREVEGVRGLHLQAIGWEPAAAQVAAALR